MTFSQNDLISGPALDEGVEGMAFATGKNGDVLYLLGGLPSDGAVRVLDCSSGTCPSAWTRHVGVIPKFALGGYVQVPDALMQKHCP